MAIIPYLSTLNHGYVLDDYSAVKENWVVQKGFEGIPTILQTSYRYGYWNSPGTLYRPISLLMFAVEWHFFPDKAGISHAINVALYGLLCVLLFLFLNTALNNVGVVLPLLTVLLFAVHPIHVEIVANIKSRDEILCFLFATISLLLYFQYIDSKHISQIFLALISYLIAMLSKESSITFLAVFPLAHFLFRKDSFAKKGIMSTLFVLPVVVYMILRYQVLGSVVGVENVSKLDNFLVDLPFLERTASAFYVMGLYLKLLIFPHPLVCDYSFNQIPAVGWSNVLSIFSFLVYLTLGIFGLTQLKKNSVVSFSILFFLITFSVYSNLLVIIGSSMGERFLFIPSLGFSLILSHFILKIFKISDHQLTGESLRKNATMFVVVGIVAFILGAKTVSRAVEWESNYTLYSSDVKKSPNSARMHYYYALELVQTQARNARNAKQKQQYLQQAISEYEQAIAIYPSYPDAYDQLGLSYYRLGNQQKAMENYQLALSYNPQKAITYSNMGAIYFQNQDYQNALRVYELAVKYDPRFADAYMNLGSTYGTLGRFDDAIWAFQEGLKYEPNAPMLHYFAAITMQRQGMQEQANYHFSRAYELNPSLRNQGR